MADMRPMLATRGTRVPSGDGWSHEVKWDGIRLLAEVRDRPRLWTRNENDATLAWPEIEEAAPARDVLVDGEVIALNDRGLPDFGVLQERMHVRRATTAERKARELPATLMVFDLLRLDGRELHQLPLSQRRALLTGLVEEGVVAGAWQVPPAYDDGAMLFDATREQGLEGIVSKRLSSRYEYGARSPHWLKFPHRRRASYVVGGWRPETGSAHRLGALLVGEPTAEGLVYRGRVGSGIAGARGPELLDLLAPLARDRPPFVDEVPRVDATGTHWVEPLLVVDVEALGMSPQLRLRQPSYRGLRPDLGPEDLT
jgi:bifunctional non-homologous end joining protein LigD